MVISSILLVVAVQVERNAPGGMMSTVTLFGADLLPQRR
jgi:hypothetical protein